MSNIRLILNGLRVKDRDCGIEINRENVRWDASMGFCWHMAVGSAGHFEFLFIPYNMELLFLGLCCVGWIFCCPIFGLTWMMRDSPMDKEDLKDDPCIPCYT